MERGHGFHCIKKNNSGRETDMIKINLYNDYYFIALKY